MSQRNHDIVLFKLHTCRNSSRKCKYRCRLSIIITTNWLHWTKNLTACIIRSPKCTFDKTHSCGTPSDQLSFICLVCNVRTSITTPYKTVSHGLLWHDDVIKWKHFPRHWPFVRGIPLKSQWRGALMFSLICTLNKRLSKQSWGWLFETSSRLLWRHCNGRPSNVDSISMSLRPHGHVCVGWCCLLEWNFCYPPFVICAVTIS